MSKFLMLECNRLNSQENYKGIDEEQDKYKNKWINNVNSYGIEVNPGDIIELNSSSINTRGTIENAIEFVGSESPSEQGFVDNKLGLELGYYINDTRSYNLMLPLAQTKTYVSHGLPSETTQDPTDKYSNANYLLNRGLGEPLLEYDRQGPSPDTSNEIPEYTTLDVSITQAGSNFVEGETYVVDYVTTPVPPQIAGIEMEIVVTEIENVDTVTGAVISFKITNVGTGYSVSDLLKVGNTGTGPDLQFTINSYPNAKTYTGFSDEITGKRYFPASHVFTGAAIIPVPSIPDGLNFNLSKADATYAQRFNNIELEIETGLNTPQNISDVLTKKLKETQKIDSYNKSLYIEDKGYTVRRFREGTAEFAEVKPPFIETPSYTLNAVNYEPKISPIDLDIGTYMGIRKYYYQSIAYENPQKLQALMWSRQLNENELNTGLNPVNNMGDFSSQTVGNLGLNCCMMSDLTVNGDLISLQKGSLILTNVYFTKENIDRIAGSLKLGERYYGNLNNQADPESNDYKDNLGIALDIGLYVDELSQGIQLRDTGKRQRFYGFQEHKFTTPVPPNNNHLDIDACIGTQDDPFFEGKYNNTGQQLSQMVIKSRFNESLTFNSGNQEFDALYNTMIGATDDKFTVTGTQKEVFNGIYTDTPSGTTYTAEDLIQMARDADIAAFPVFPVGSDGAFIKEGGTPYIAFSSLLQTTADPNELFNPITFEGWKIDAPNCKYGLQLGYDCSFLRNSAVQMRNVKNKDIEERIDALYLGASDMSFNFDPNLSRFTIQGMNTPMTVGNGFAYNEFSAGIINEASINPEQTCALISNSVGIQSFQANETIRTDFFNMKQSNNTIIDSYTGVVINGIVLYDKQGNPSRYGLGDPRLNNSLVRGTMISKLGFDIFDILPRLGTIQTPYNPISASVPLTQQNSYLEAYRTQIRPISTGLFISSPELQPASQNTLKQPLYDIGLPSIYQSQPSALQGSLVASNLPTKLDYPYLIVHSSLCSTNVDTHYYGGKTGRAKINAIGIITRNYNQGDFFYGLGQTYYYTAVKRFVLTEVSTEILLPDGTRPTLDPASAVIYKITKPLNIPVPIPIEQAQKGVIKKKKQG